MGRLSALWRIAATWYVSVLLLGGLGIVLGFSVFFYVYPGKPKIGIIDIPFTVINDNSAFEIGALLSYVRQEDSIKGVVINLTSPGGSAASSEHLFFEISNLRKKKPVVMVMNDLVASGGYMMSLGTNYSYTKPSSFVGGIGVILSPLPPLISRTPNERDGFTGPFKLEGGDRRHYVKMTEQLKQAFAQIVLTQRGEKLQIPLSEVMQGLIYTGVNGVRLGLIDGIGGEADAIEKAASLAGISGYGLVDVNTEVSRIFNEKRARITDPLERLGAAPSVIDLGALRSQLEEGAPVRDSGIIQSTGTAPNADVLRRLPPPGSIGEDPENALPGFPMKITGPNAYYLSVSNLIGRSGAEERTAMKTIFNNIGKVLRKQRGFTLVEMVTVVAIMGVMAAVAVPMVSSQLGKAREKSYLQDRAMIQTAVDSFFTAADNVRYLGQRQYPIEGTDSTGDAVLWANAGSDGSVASAGNPLRGVQGGEPQWNDDGDGTREAGEETLNGADDAASGTGPGWFVAQVTFQSESYAADSQDYFIDFEKLVTAGLLQQAPESASPDNGGGSTEGSYSWYVKKTGQIESLFYHLPSNGVSPFGGLDLRNFVDGVYP